MVKAMTCGPPVMVLAGADLREHPQVLRHHDAHQLIGQAAVEVHLEDPGGRRVGRRVRALAGQHQYQLERAAQRVDLIEPHREVAGPVS